MNIFESYRFTTNWMWGAYYLLTETADYELEHRLRKTRLVDFGITYDEWQEIYVNLIKIENLLPKNKIAYTTYEGYTKILGIMGKIPKYPKMSKIRSGGIDVFFERNEIKQLKTECLELEKIATNSVALRGLDKLIRTCELAQKLDMVICFSSN
jgi:hypothetical protein